MQLKPRFCSFWAHSSLVKVNDDVFVQQVTAVSFSDIQFLWPLSVPSLFVTFPLSVLSSSFKGVIVTSAGQRISAGRLFHSGKSTDTMWHIVNRLWRGSFTSALSAEGIWRKKAKILSLVAKETILNKDRRIHL